MQGVKRRFDLRHVKRLELAEFDADVYDSTYSSHTCPSSTAVTDTTENAVAQDRNLEVIGNSSLFLATAPVSNQIFLISNA